MIPPISPSDVETAKKAFDLMVWAGEHIKAWIESRESKADASAKPSPKTKTPNAVAIAVRISRMNVADVKAFLAAHKIDAQMIVVANSEMDEPVHLLNDPDLWEAIVREFYTAFTQIQAERGAKTFHTFLAAPAALAFAMGCTMSTFFDVHLYQWDPDRQTYVEVIRGTSRRRLMTPAKNLMKKKR